MILIKSGNIHLENKTLSNADILIEGEKILKVGKNLSSDFAKVIDASGKEVFPGFISPVTGVGLQDHGALAFSDVTETTDPIVPHLSVKYAIDKREITLQQYHYSGITAFGSAPGPQNLLFGLCCVYNTYGKTIKQMCIKEDFAVRGSFTSAVKNTYGATGAPMTKMGMASMLRNAFIDAKNYGEKKDKPFDEKKETLLKMLRRQLPLIISVTTAPEIMAVISITKEFNLDTILLGAYQLDKCIDDVKEAGIKVILSDLYGMGNVVSYNTDLKRLASLLNDGFAFGGATAITGGREELLWVGIKMCQYGADADKAINMLTINNARLLGVDNVIGSIEEGKQADIVIYSAHPLKTYDAHVECMLVKGEIAYEGNGGFEKCCL